MPREPEMKQLGEGSSIKDDLQTIYEAIQDLGYTEYSVLKLLDRLREYVEELKRLSFTEAREDSFDLRDIRERTKELQGDLDGSTEDLKDRIHKISDQVEGVLKELKNVVQATPSADLQKIAAQSHILILASKQVLAQNGFDPETGIRVSEMDQDWKRFKDRFGNFIWTLVFTGISILIMWAFTSYQRAQTDEQHAMIKQATITLQQTGQNQSKKDEDQDKHLAKIEEKLNKIVPDKTLKTEKPGPLNQTKQ